MSSSTRIGSGVFAGLAVSVALIFLGCSMDAKEGEVRVEIQETLSEAQQESLKSKLSALTDGSSTKSQNTGGKVIFVFGGVKDVKAFADKITFAKVVEVKEAERTVILSVE